MDSSLDTILQGEPTIISLHLILHGGSHEMISFRTEQCSNLDQNKHATRPKIEPPRPPKSYLIKATKTTEASSIAAADSLVINVHAYLLICWVSAYLRLIQGVKAEILSDFNM